MTRYKCYSCGKTFGSPEEKEEHQFAFYHGKYRDDYEGDGMPRNVMGGR